jgi:hypothetical protein
VGGEGWGVGLDYNLAFNPDLGQGTPYVLSTASLLRDMSWDGEKGILSLVLYDRYYRSGNIDIQWKPESFQISGTEISIDGKMLKAADYYDAVKHIVSIPYKHNQPTKEVHIYCKGKKL